MIRTLLVATMALGISSVALAQESPQAPAEDGPKPKTGISSVLGMLDLGASYSDVLAAIKADIDARYQDQLDKLVDTLAIDRLLKKKAEEFAAVEKTYIRFTGQRTGYESSLIENDFLANQDESVLRVDDGPAQRYYFFKHDRLWKVLVAYSSKISGTVPFDKFAGQVTAKHGAPKAMVRDGQTLMSSTWEDEVTQLVVEDRTGFFGTYVMKFLDKAEGVAMEAARSDKQGVSAMAGPAGSPYAAKADSLMADIMGGGDEDSGGDDVVDRLTGVSHDVDLNSGRPEYETVYQAVPQVENDGAATKKSKKKDAPRPAKRGGAAKKAPAAPAEPYIIY